MYNIINQNKSNNLDLNKEYTLIDLLPKKDEPNMKNELKNFLKSQLNISQGTDIMTLDSSNSSYSNY